MQTTERDLKALRKLSREADDLKLQIEEKKVLSGVALGDVTTWSNEVEAKLASVVERNKKGSQYRRGRRGTLLCRRKGKSFWNLSEPSLN